MDETAAPICERPDLDSQTLEGWAATQASHAASASLSLLLVSGHQPPSLVESNNNSICQAFQSSNEHAHLCEPYCGQAYQRAMNAGAVTHYRCHAGLHCFAMPVALGDGQPLAIIGGRAFLKSADYRALVERIRAGDLQSLLAGDLFNNVIFASQEDLDELIRNLRLDVKTYENENQEASDSEQSEDLLDVEAAMGNPAESKRAETATKKITGARAQATSDSFFPFDQTFSDAISSALEAFGEKHGLATLALLRHENKTFVPWYATGRLQAASWRLLVEFEQLPLPLNTNSIFPLELTENGKDFKLLSQINRQHKHQQELAPKTAAELFPLVIGEQVEGALLVASATLNDEQQVGANLLPRDGDAARSVSPARRVGAKGACRKLFAKFFGAHKFGRACGDLHLDHGTISRTAQGRARFAVAL